MRIIICLIFFILISCEKNQIRKEYYSSGELKLELEINNNKLKNGYYKEFYKGGQIKTRAHYKNDILVDTIIGYFESGKVQHKQFKTISGDSCYKFGKDGLYFMKGKIIENKMSEWWKMIYPNNGMLVMKEFRSVPENLVYENQNIVYYDNKIIDSLSTYYKIKVKDTLTKNISSDIEFEYYSPYTTSKDKKISSSVNFYYSRNFNKDFTNKKQIKVDSLTLKDFKLKTNITMPKKGKCFIRGYFIEHSSEIIGYNKDSTNVNMQLSENKIYFEKEVFVKDGNG